VSEEHCGCSGGNAGSCRRTCAYCDRRPSEGPTWWGGRCTRTESELVYRHPGDLGRAHVIVHDDGRAEIVVPPRDPWSPAALLRAAFAGRLRGAVG
jgi:hypothetical protein